MAGWGESPEPLSGIIAKAIGTGAEIRVGRTHAAGRPGGHGTGHTAGQSGTALAGTQSPAQAAGA